MTSNNRTIGVFDSGFGGLTVLRALLPLIRDARYIYLGDTARLPYGSKSRETIARYAVSSAKFLHDQGADLLVIACNTATALALADIQPGAQAAFTASTSSKNAIIPSEARSEQSRDPRISSDPPPIWVPHLRDGLIVTKVGEPPQLSTQTTKNNAVILSEAKDPCISPGPPPISTQAEVLVLATTATVQSHAYTRALAALNLEAYEKACPLLVPLVEEGWINHPVTDEVLRIYLTEALAQAPAANTLLLGCTHYPLLEPAIRRTLASIHHPLTLIDSAEATARAVAAHLELTSHPSTLIAKNSQCTFYATDSVEKFQHLGSSFLGQPVAQVNLIDLGG
jgi:glutamate racemase